MDEGKQRSRRDEWEKRKEDSKRGDRDREREGEKEKIRDLDREKRESEESERVGDADLQKGDREDSGKIRVLEAADRRQREGEKVRERTGERREREKARDRDSERRERESDKVRDRDLEKRERERDIDKVSEKRERDREREKDSDKVRDRDSEKREREKERGRSSERARDYRDSEKREREYRRVERERSSEGKHRDKYKDSRYKESEKDGSRSRRRDEREKERGRDREEDPERLKEKGKDRERDDGARTRERAREKDRERVREREERDREREEREREREREEKEERERGRDRMREREKRRDEDRDREDEIHERKKRRREDEQGSERESSRYKEENGDDVRRKKSEEELKKGRKEEDVEEENRKLDEEMDKRRRRVQEWQELKRKREEQEREKRGEEKTEEEPPKSGKNWTLEGEESDDEESEHPSTKTAAAASKGPVVPVANGDAKSDDPMMVDSEDNGNGNRHPLPDENGEEEGEEIDPLDAFMNSMVLPEVEKLKNAEAAASTDNMLAELGKKKASREVLGNGDQSKKASKNATGRIIPGEDSDSDYEHMENDEAPLEDEDDDEFIKRVKKTKAEKLSIVDHSKIQYPPFRKNFYIEVKEISRMTTEEVAAYRKMLELKIHGKDVPMPIKTWNQTGLTSKILETIKKSNFEKPMPIQAQALPIIMSGRDCIGIAKTGSGKTLAFVLPMLRHIKDQPPVVPGDGPIGLIMAPTRELVQQIHSDIKKFAKVVGVNCVPVYGGSGVAQQISDLKRGTEIVVCTPGRMIDILCTSGGKISNLRRVTYLVMDEADRMFDMGFEPQITRIVQNTRPDRQTVLFSATFPRQVEILARKVLNKPVEIQVGGRSVVNKDITQLVEVRQDNERFLRLLELLGEWYEKGKILIFVHSQEKCDSLFKELLRHGYPCLSLHGAKDQTDRESTISDFKSNVCNLLIATSIAARGLDVKELELVVNYDVPNHYEDYVHRVGRTGRAGRKGCAVTFITEEDARYAPDLVKALELSEQAVPDDLKQVADGFMAKVNQGTEHAHGTGYGGSGFKFNEEEDEARRAAKKAQAREYGFEEDKSDSDSEEEGGGVRKAGGDISQAAAFAQAAAIAAASKVAMTSSLSLPPVSSQFLPLQTTTAAGAGMGVLGAPPSLPVVGGLPNDAAARAAALAAALNLQHNLAKIQADAMPEHYEAELEINDFPQNARWKVTHKETLGPISEWTGAAITTRGQYYPPGKIPGPGERKLYLFIEGPTESSVKKAKAEVKRVLEDYTAQSLSLPGAGQPGKYSVL
ncbi:hypothetical protein AMTRI_Chr05g69490 [Amborella trichopoda]|uniref:RNA helicase n=1 Tax=Amborella trichopoda TaxID=13333 RepID=W1NEU6_AMBTC|nr:DEAD-box ATP-dependent RNA helicase 42 [Amborella trichopoda]ERM93966.1 hypothetical protein AMTR_s00136p00027550 [Amborella trichopoda]|eukprot:XP_006826729.1 DEAD-box ATP-dependent RNA helicase 42 [Amborella trichopoda]